MAIIKAKPTSPGRRGVIAIKSDSAQRKAAQSSHPIKIQKWWKK